MNYRENYFRFKKMMNKSINCILTVNNTLNANNNTRIHFIPPSTILTNYVFPSQKNEFIHHTRTIADFSGNLLIVGIPIKILPFE